MCRTQADIEDLGQLFVAQVRSTRECEGDGGDANGTENFLTHGITPLYHLHPGLAARY